MYILQIEHCQQHEAPNVLFLKEICMFLFLMFLTHTAAHQAIRCDLGMLTDYCSYQGSFFRTLPSSQGQSYLKIFPRHFYIQPRSFEVHLLLAAPNGRRSYNLTRRRVCIFSVPTVHNIATTAENHFLFSSKYRTQRDDNVCRGCVDNP